MTVLVSMMCTAGDSDYQQCWNIEHVHIVVRSDWWKHVQEISGEAFSVFFKMLWTFVVTWFLLHDSTHFHLSLVVMWLWSYHPIPQTCHNPTFSVSTSKKCSERTTIRKCWGNHCKSDESTDRCIKKWFPGMLPKALWMLAKVCHYVKELLWRKCVNRYNVTNFCVISQFQELFEATCTREIWKVLELPQLKVIKSTKQSCYREADSC
jgi:hypothetical protein